MCPETGELHFSKQCIKHKKSDFQGRTMYVTMKKISTANL